MASQLVYVRHWCVAKTFSYEVPRYYVAIGYFRINQSDSFVREIWKPNHSHFRVLLRPKQNGAGGKPLYFHCL